MKRILIISFSDLSKDPRVNRQVRILSKEYQVTAAGTHDPNIPGVQFLKLYWGRRSFRKKLLGAVQLASGFAEAFYWSQPGILESLKALKNIEFDLVLANDIETLPLAVRIASGRQILFDAHEYSPLEYEESFFFRAFIAPYRTKLCREYLPKSSAMTTVCLPIAEKYYKEFGVRSEVITNAPYFMDLEPHRGSNSVIKLVHHGIAAPARHLEISIEMMSHLPDFELHFFLVGEPKYVEHLKKRSQPNNNIFFHEPVAMRDLPRILNDFDLGLFLLPAFNFNYRYALPNKLFEFIQARLGVAVGPSPEMARIVREYGLGIVSEDFSASAMVKTLRKLNHETIWKYKLSAHKHAKALSAIPNEQILLRAVSRLASEV